MDLFSRPSQIVNNTEVVVFRPDEIAWLRDQVNSLFQKVQHYEHMAEQLNAKVIAQQNTVRQLRGQIHREMGPAGDFIPGQEPITNPQFVPAPPNYPAAGQEIPLAPPLQGGIQEPPLPPAPPGRIQPLSDPLSMPPTIAPGEALTPPGRGPTGFNPSSGSFAPPAPSLAPPSGSYDPTAPDRPLDRTSPPETTGSFKKKLERGEAPIAIRPQKEIDDMKRQITKFEAEYGTNALESEEQD